jgi:hypothetical protein
MSHLRRFLFCLSLCFVIVAQIIAARKTREQATSQHMLIGHTTAQQAITLAEPVFQALLAPQKDLWVSAEPLETAGVARHWLLSCVDSQGIEIGHLRLDADNSEILVFDRSDTAPLTRHAMITKSSEEAVAKARAYLMILGHQAAWHWGAAGHSGRFWKIDLIADHRQASLVIDATKGTLMSAMIYVVKG